MVIADGGVTTALACVAAVEASLSRVGASAGLGAADGRTLKSQLPEEAFPVVWTPVFVGPTGAARLRAVERMCEFLGLRLVRGTTEIDGSPERVPGLPEGDRAEESAAQLMLGEDTSRMLLAAGFEAGRTGCETALWPIQFSLGAEIVLGLVSQAVDRALLVSRLVSIDLGESGAVPVTIEPAYADFSDAQVADLVMDMDAPIELCWWWHAEAAGAKPEHTALFRGERKRWMKVLEPIGWTRANR